jgi:hypothetical protein
VYDWYSTGLRGPATGPTDGGWRAAGLGRFVSETGLRGPATGPTDLQPLVVKLGAVGLISSKFTHWVMEKHLDIHSLGHSQ